MMADDLDWGSNNVEDCQENVIYRALYHSSVATCGNLQQQLTKCSGHLHKHRKIAELMVGAL